MEPAQTEDNFSEVLVLLDILEVAHVVIKPQHIRFNSFRRFLSHLQRSLEKRDRELRVRAGREE